MLEGLLLALALGVAGAQDTGGPPEAATVVPGKPPKPVADWPPEHLGNVPLPSGVQVRSPGPRQQSLDLDGARLVAGSAWPVWVEKGHLPLQLELENKEGRPRRLLLDIGTEADPERRRVLRPVDLEPGGRVALEVVVPAFEDAGYQSSYQVRVREEGRPDQLLAGGLGAGTWVGGAEHNILVVQHSLPRLGAIDAWTAALPGALVSTVRTSDLPTGPEAMAAWTSLDVVVLETGEGLPPPAALDPLLAWVRLGGTLVLAGPETSLPEALQRWLEPRFAWPQGASGPNGTLYSAGLGLVARTPLSGDWDAPDRAGLLWAALQQGAARSFVPDAGANGRGGTLHIDIPGVGELPRVTLSLLLVGLAVLLGPVNLLLVRASDRPPLMLVSTPLLALASGGALVAWGLLRDGLDVRVRSQTLTLLDQRDRRASTMDATALFAGRAQARGLRPGPGTALFPSQPYGEGSWTIREGAERELSGTRFLPARQKVWLRALSEQTTARRLDLRPGERGLLAANHLGAPIRSLLVHTSEGGWWTTAGKLADGEEGALERARLDPPTGEVMPPGDLLTFGNAPAIDLLTPGPLPPGTYLALLDGQPFRDRLGLEADEEPGLAYVLGVLEAAP